MDKTLLTYDAEGYILQNITGSYRIPVGVPYLEVEVLEGKRAISIDISINPHVPIYEDLPIDPVAKIQADLDYIAMMTGVEL